MPEVCEKLLRLKESILCLMTALWIFTVTHLLFKIKIWEILHSFLKEIDLTIMKIANKLLKSIGRSHLSLHETFWSAVNNAIILYNKLCPVFKYLFS